jgi:hypothetical protein
VKVVVSSLAQFDAASSSLAPFDAASSEVVGSSGAKPCASLHNAISCYAPACGGSGAVLLVVRLVLVCVPLLRCHHTGRRFPPLAGIQHRRGIRSR